jgi:hypothetical protein
MDIITNIWMKKLNVLNNKLILIIKCVLNNLIDISQNITNNKCNNVQTIPSEVTKLCNQYIKI